LFLTPKRRYRERANEGRSKLASAMLQQIVRLGEGGTFSPEDIRVLVAAFDKAWASVAASRAPSSEPEQHEWAREVLAKAIIQSAKAGERDVGALAAAALLQLSKAPLRRKPQAPQNDRNRSA
jgi:hypothetical protein